MKLTRTKTVYVALLVAWAVIGLWQLLEHRRVKESARQALVNRARDISYSLAAVVRSQERFFFVWQPRLEAALEGLAKSEELLSVALLNSSGQVVASAGRPVDLDSENLPERGDRWEKKTVTFVNPIDLGTGGEDGGATSPATIILASGDERTTRPDRRGPPRPPDDERAPRPDRRGPPRPTSRSIVRTSESVIVRLEFPPDTPTSGPGSIRRPERERGEPKRDVRPPEPSRVTVDRTSDSTVMILEYPPDTPTTGPGSVAWGGGDRDGFRRRGPTPRHGGPPPFGRPFWMSPERYEQLLQKQGLHGFVLVMSTDQYRAEKARDSWLRLFIAGISLVAVAGLGLAWRNVDRSSQLQLRLVRASEMNAHLREMNVAAAGLAHETRNPLNIVRGLAQMISQEEGAPTDVRTRSREITEEVDRVTGRLNEFIDYSKPREAKPAPTSFTAVVREVERTLESDREDKRIEFALDGPDLTVEADESLLRQVLFNLLLNATQAANPGGRVEVVMERNSADEAWFEVRDNGPGVPENLRGSIFRPYFTTHEAGSGLGLAVVRQIVLAHGWDIEYLPNEGHGARFRVSGLKVTTKGL